MSESLASRVGRMISGSINALVDAVENAAPDIVMEQAIREVDDVIGDVRLELGRVIAAKHLASNRFKDENNRFEELAEKIEIAIAKDRDDLAEAAIARQLDIEVQIPVLEQSIAEFSQKEKELDSYILALQARKREMQAELNEFRQTMAAQTGSKEGSPSGVSLETNQGHSHNVEKAQGAFDRVYQNATGVVAGDKGDMRNAAKLAELSELAHKNRIQERLQAIKGKMGNE
ncbi:Phage shock protein A [Halioglobus japonicus]|nr:Phage shock protein A [Halioglobus japonicus]